MGRRGYTTMGCTVRRSNREVIFKERMAANIPHLKDLILRLRK
jgi:hypothetical protein